MDKVSSSIASHGKPWLLTMTENYAIITYAMYTRCIALRPPLTVNDSLVVFLRLKENLIKAKHTAKTKDYRACLDCDNATPRQTAAKTRPCGYLALNINLMK